MGAEVQYSIQGIKNNPTPASPTVSIPQARDSSKTEKFYENSGKEHSRHMAKNWTRF